MGKTSSPQKKPTISTNATFKKPAKEALRTVKASKVPKASKQRPEHQLSAAFSGQTTSPCTSLWSITDTIVF